MKTYPIALELTAWVELGINQYEITIDDKSTLSVKRTDDVLHTRELTSAEAISLIEAIGLVEVPVLEFVNTKTTKASSSYELIIESDQSGSLTSISGLAQLIEKIGQFH